MGERSAQNDGMTPIQETPRKSLSRRALLGLAAGAALVPVAVSGGTAQARRRVGPAPETVALPDGFRPEGIASGPGTTYYAGSMANGRIVTGDLLGRSAVGAPPAGRRSSDPRPVLRRSEQPALVRRQRRRRPCSAVRLGGRRRHRGRGLRGSPSPAAASTTTSSSRTPTSTSPTRGSTGWSGYRSTPQRGSPAAASASSRSAAHGRWARREPPTPTVFASCRTARSSSTTAASAGCGRSTPTTGVATDHPRQGRPGHHRRRRPRDRRDHALQRARQRPELGRPSCCSRSPEPGGRRSGPAPAATRRWTSPRPPPSRVAGSG